MSEGNVHKPMHGIFGTPHCTTYMAQVLLRMSFTAGSGIGNHWNTKHAVQVMTQFQIMSVPIIVSRTGSEL